MDQLSVCKCPRCQTHFAMASEQVDEVDELTCPVCEETFDPTGEDVPEVKDDELANLVYQNPRRRKS